MKRAVQAQLARSVHAASKRGDEFLAELFRALLGDVVSFVTEVKIDPGGVHEIDKPVGASFALDCPSLGIPRQGQGRRGATR